ncbi:DNA binding domain-containing protein, excisionase family [Sphingobium sp. YR657]|uniref:helix-turn-helix domain-containing protein n=1 Tax=Sphingobium sp. YR657 TaxID=1884366 RepID=UPI000924902B|nr:helix-turn-helix domain-containing protein [Sphingobium sp. YR657]SHL52261.1 DNA binding domain-containing protein, excisionase family [Sphingobium sp. YR657]
MEDDENIRASKARKGSPFLTAKQAAHYLGLGAKTLANMRSLGEGPHYRRHGGHIRYHIDDLDRWSLERARCRANARPDKHDA